jgi:protein O-GlcNAc transferase
VEAVRHRRFPRKMIVLQSSSASDLDLAIVAHEKGDLDTAEAGYRRVLAHEPNDPDALHLLGLVLHRTGRTAEAIATLQAAVAADPSAAEFHNDLGHALLTLGRFDEAADCLRTSVTHDASLAQPLFNLGTIYEARGAADEAESHYRQALQRDGDYLEACVALANICKKRGDLAEAIDLYRRAIRTNSINVALRFQLAELLWADAPVDAVEQLRIITELEPADAAAHHRLGNALRRLGRAREAVAALRRAVELDPATARHHSDFGLALQLDQRNADALRAHFAAARLSPSDASVQTDLGYALFNALRLSEARDVLRWAMELDPASAQPIANLGTVCQTLGQVEQAMTFFRAALTLEPESSRLRSDLLLCQNYRVADPRQTLAAHVEWARHHAEASLRAIPVHTNSRDEGQRLRIGYVSPDFREHAVARFFEPILENRDKSRFDAVCYSHGVISDARTAALRGLSDAWRSIVGLNDRVVAGQIRDDGIDILVDLAGHTARSRLTVFALRPAPIHVTYIGYPNTTGMRAIDYRIVDALTDPPGLADGLCVERLVRLPGCFLCYRPPDDAPPVSGLPAYAHGVVTFGSFNHLPKISPKTMDLWAQTLQAIPNSRLTLKAKGLIEAEARAAVLGELTDRGIAAGRIELLPPEPLASRHLARYAEVDIALDTFPYHGTTTTCEALWMGVPVISRVGDVHASRVGRSLLTAAGLMELAVGTDAEYVAAAAALASDLRRLADLRATMRERLRASVLLDGASLTRNLEAAYLEMWGAWMKAR